MNTTQIEVDALRQSWKEFAATPEGTRSGDHA
jgi:hypothetical protein